MRWPHFFGRGSAAKDPQAREPRAPLREWASLPAIQRVVGMPDLTAPTSAFVHSLAGMHDPDLSLEPLGHHVALDAPAGLVAGLARNVETYAPSHELATRPRPRPESVARRRLFGSTETIVAPSAGDVAIEADAPIDAAAGPPPAMSFAAIDEPVRAHAPLTRMPDAEASAILRLGTHRPVVQTSAAPIPDAVSAAPAPEPTRTVAAQRLTLGQSRRLGLGAPISNLPAATVQRALDATALALAPPARSMPADRLEATSETVAQSAEQDAEDLGAPAAEGIAPIAGAMIQRREVPEAGGAALPGGPPTGPTAAAPRIEMPLAPERASTQRAVASPLPPLFQRPAPAPTAPLVSDRPPLLRVRRASAADAGAAFMPDPVTVQRASGVTRAEPTSQMRSAAGIVSASGPAWQHEVASPNTRPPGGLPPLPRPVPAVQRVQAAVQDFVAYSPFASPPGPALTSSWGAAGDLPVLQREVAAGESPASESAAAAAPVTPAAGAGPAAAEAPGPSDKELDELARKLHDRISLHLRRDLLIQRERAGLVSDLR